ncbi:MAG: T9SS type A sorting domain-containing protein [Bacteroidia bacterium]
MKKLYLLFCLMTAFLAANAQTYFGNMPPLAGGTSTTGGITFQLESSASIFIDTIYCRFSTTSGDYRVWYSTTSLTGPPNVSAPDWVELVAAHSGTAGNNLSGQTNVVAIPIPNGYLMNAGIAHRFYVGVHSGSVNYTSTSSLDVYTDNTVTISTGTNVSYAGGFPTPTIHPRAFNGGLFYRFATGLDMRPAAIISPQTLITGANTVTIRYQNAAADPIFSADFGYQVNNNPPVTELAVPFFPPLGPGQTYDHTFVLPINTTGPTSLDFRAWNSNANGLGADSNPGNDTISRVLCSGITGTFSIGGIAADYPDIHAAIADLNNCGVIGPVNFNISPGTYHGTYTLRDIPGIDPTSPIVFNGLSGNAADVILIQDTAAASSTNRSHFILNTEGSISFQNLTFRRTQNTTAAGQAVLIYSDPLSTGNIFGCVFEDINRPNSTFNNGIIHRGKGSVISSNSFSGFYYQIFFDAPANSWGDMNQVIGNTFENYIYRSLYLLNQENAIVSANVFENFVGTSTAGAAIWSVNSYNFEYSGNHIRGDMSAYAMMINNPNGDPVAWRQNTNKIYNNVINGQQAASIISTAMVANMFHVTGSFSATTTPPNPRDAIEILHNTVAYRFNSTSASTIQAGLWFTGGTTATRAWSWIHVKNNHIDIGPLSGDLPIAFRLVRFANQSQIDSLESNNNNFRIGGANPPEMFRNNSPVADYPTLASWQTATSKDAASVSMNPGFLSATELIPTVLPFDNLGAPISYITTDIMGNTRNPATPDIGAYEFTGGIFSQISVNILSDTLVGPNRVLTADIADTSSTIVSGSARLIYRKQGQSTWQMDTVPTVTGTNHQFVIDYTALGGVVPMDIVEYYVAVANTAGFVTTAPRGGEGLYPASGATLPAQLYSYLLFPAIAGTYRVGTSGTADFPTLTAAANFINAGLVAGPADFILIDTLYSQNETFPIVINKRPGMAASNPIRFRPDSSVAHATIEGTVPFSNGLIVLSGAQHLTFDGANNGGSSRNLTIRTHATVENNAAIWLRSTPGANIEGITIKNLHVVGGINNIASSFGIHAGGANISTFGTGDSLYDITIENITVQRAFYAIYVRSLFGAPGRNVRITDNEIGSTDTSRFITFRGVDVQNVRNAEISRNTIYNILVNTAAIAGIEIGGTPTDSARISSNRIYNIRNFNPSGSGAYGISVLAGSNAIIDNNAIYGIAGMNGTATSTLSAMGIRLAGGTNHGLYYNSVYVYGDYTNTNNTEATAAALGIISTAVTGEVMNNAFAANFTTNASGPNHFVAVWVPNNYNFGQLALDRNAYYVPDSLHHAVGRVGTAAGSGMYNQVNDWRTVSTVSNVNNDLFSIPGAARMLPPFTSNTNLTVPTGTVTGMESGGAVIAALGSPNVDINGINRPAGTGLAPDIGAFEFDGQLAPDQFPPVIDSFTITPDEAQCTPTPRTVTIYASDNAGGIGIDSIILARTVDGVAQPNIILNRIAGTSASGTWQGIVPAAPAALQEVVLEVVARDSLANFTNPQQLARYTDEYLAIDAGNDTIIVAGDTATLRAAVTGFSASNVVIAETIAGNGQSGVTFNVRAINAVEIDSLQVWMYGIVGGTGNMDIWYSTSPINGAPNISAPGWTQVTSAYPGLIQNSGITGVGIFTPIPLNTPVVIPAGSTYGFYIGGSSIAYTSHVAGAVDTFTDGNIVIYTGPNVGYGGAAPSPTFHPRMFNGAVSYKGTGSVAWTELGSTTVLGTDNVIQVTPPVTTTYVATVTDSVCFKMDTVTVFVGVQMISDVGITEILTPSTVNALNQPYTVKVVIENFGNQPAAGFDVAYRLAGGPIINSNSIARTIAPGDTIHHTFTQAWTPTVGGTVTLCAYSSWTADTNPANDTTCASYQAVKVEEVHDLVGRVYPNPASQFVKFDIAAQEGVGTLEIRDNLGRVVWRETVEVSIGNTHQISTEAYAAGVYNYRFMLGEKLQQGQFMIRR